MSKLRRSELQGFFRDLEKWNRVVVGERTAEAADADAEPREQDSGAERHLFIRVSCDTDVAELGADAKLA